MTFDEFVTQVRALLEPTAKGKGYSSTGVDGHNALYEFVQGTVGGDGHAIGEIIYKAKRYAAKGNPEDLLKAAAWAFLVLKHRPPVRSFDDARANPLPCKCGKMVTRPELCPGLPCQMPQPQGDGAGEPFDSGPTGREDDGA
jgi:hypothetical protein